jgi:hypothetical protein
VADLAGVRVTPAVEAPVEDQPGADPRAHGQVDDVREAAARAEAPLCQGGGVGVVLDRNRAAQLPLHERDDRHRLPAREVRRIDQLAALHVDRTRRRDSHRRHRIARHPRLYQQPPDVVDHARDVVLGTSAGSGGPSEAPQDRPVLVAEGQRELGAADVDPQQQQGGNLFRLGRLKHSSSKVDESAGEYHRTAQEEGRSRR